MMWYYFPMLSSRLPAAVSAFCATTGRAIHSKLTMTATCFMTAKPPYRRQSKPAARELPSLFTANLFIEQPPDTAAIKTMAASWRIACMGIILSQYKKVIMKLPQRFSRAWTE